jgi:hypothetical protein
LIPGTLFLEALGEVTESDFLESFRDLLSLRLSAGSG